MTFLHRLRPLLDWRAAAVDEWAHRGAAAMLDESMRRSHAALRLPPYRLGDSDGTRLREPEDIVHDADTSPLVIALSGRAGAGKDTVAAILAETHGLVRVALADPLRDMALSIDPVILDNEGVARYLSWLVNRYGWDRAKRHHNVRRFLQRLGTEGVRRHLGDDTWVRLCEQRCRELRAEGRGVVVTDVRYPNEVAMVRRLGGYWLHVVRPGTNPAAGHVSEEALDVALADGWIRNDGTLEALRWQVAEALRCVEALQ